MKKLVLTTIAATALLFGSNVVSAQVLAPAGGGTVAPGAPVVSPAPAPAPVTGGGVMTFEEETHDFGDLVQGGDASYVFKFTNTGTEDIVISGAKGSCGCTVPKWSSDAVAPGAEGEIRVQYDSNRIGMINKSVTITSNAKEPVKTIYIKGNITPKPAEPSFFAPQEGAPANH